MDDLIAAVVDVRDKLRQSVYSNEDQVSKGVVMRLLRELRWPVFDPNLVKTEFSIGTRRVDYALIREHRGPAVLVEVKGVGKLTSAGEEQLLNYCFRQGVPLAVLTDGRSWKFYYPAGTGTYERRLFMEMDLMETEDTRCVEILRRYLLFDSVRSGRSLRDVRNDYDRREEKHVMKQQFEPVWKSLVADPKSAFIAVFCDEVEQRCGVRPEGAEVADFLRSRFVAIAAGSGDDRPASPPGERSGPVSYELFGERSRAFSNNAELAAALLAEFANRYPGFCEELAPRVNVSSSVLSRRREDFQGRSREWARKLPGGWWMNGVGTASTHLSRIREACEVAGIEYGRDLTVTLRGKRGAEQTR